jgi:uncharacterized protein
MTGEGHGPDPGSDEWWAACERLRARRGAPSFDCSKALSLVEALICSDPELVALDLALGMSGDLMGTRFMASRESLAPEMSGVTQRSSAAPALEAQESSP